MNKSRLAFAFAALAAGTASAQSSVTLYGRVDLGLVVDNGSAGHAVRLSSGVAKGSNLGFRGLEDLGDGFKAGFQLETAYCADSASTTNPCAGSTQFMGRQARGDFITPYGTLSAGRVFSRAYFTMLRMDPFLGTAGQMNNIIDASAFRINNTVRYITPSFAGLSASADLSLGETTGSFRAGREIGGSVDYDNGPLRADAVYYHANNANGIGTARQNVMLTATYDFGVVKLHALTQRSIGSPTGTTRIDGLAWMAGVSAPLAGGRAMASYVSYDDRVADRDANQLAVGYTYPLSKQVNLYGAWGRIANKNGATYKVGNASENGTGTRSVNLGVSYDF
jgi:predicted porin